MEKLRQHPSPSRSLVLNLQHQLSQVLPFAEMEPGHIEQFITAAREFYFEPDEVILDPNSGPVEVLYFVRQGAVVGRKGIAQESSDARRIDTGEFFPVSAAVAGRAVSSIYTALGDCFCLGVSRETVMRLSEASPPFAAFISQRILQFLERSRKLIQRTYASEVFTALSLETPLGALPRKVAVTVPTGAAVRDALMKMHETRVGSVLITDAQDRLVGILTRDDIVSRVALANVSLDAPIDDVMSPQVRFLHAHDTAQDAALMMSRYGIQHVPVLDEGRVINIVSERDLFSAQRLSLKAISGSIRSAGDVEHLKASAAEVRQFAQTLLGQGVQSRQLTALISHLNDLICERLVTLSAERHGLDLQSFSWMALGSEGRGEQTVATDQDNAIVFQNELPHEGREALAQLAREVNEGLDACGFPLCKGQIMASNPALCLSEEAWLAQFAGWIEHGSPEALLKSSIFFDFRTVAGSAALTESMRALITARAKATPRFLKQLAENSLRNQVPLNWHGGIDTVRVDGRDCLDLKLHGTAIVVDVARILALAQGVESTHTRSRLERVGQALGVSSREYESWLVAFEFLQTLRLNLQIQGHLIGQNPNLLDLSSLNDIDRSILKESLKTLRLLQQRLELDYAR
jgi:CBS domain-containing protein